MRIALLSNVTVDVLAGLLGKTHELWLAPGFGAWREMALNVPDGLKAFAPEAVFLLLDASHATYAESACARACAALEAALPASAVVPVDLADLADGVDGFYDERLWQVASMPWSLKGLHAIRAEIERLCGLLHGGAKKVLALDFDNTLWRGVISEDGPDGIAPDRAFQSAVKALRARGVLLVGLSKNDAADVEPVWTDPRMVLKRTDFAALRVDWNAKAANLAACARELNLGTDAFVSCDDSPAERAAMRAGCPEVAVPEWPIAGRRLARLYFPPLRTTAEDRNRPAQYRDEGLRRDLQRQCADYEAYLKDLAIRVTVRPAEESDLPRVAQLAQKCSQFNVLTNRYGLAEVAALRADPRRMLLVAHAADRFGDLGLVAFVSAKVTDATASVTDWVMSCRAMNRRIEFEIEDAFERRLAARGVRVLNARRVATAKNAPVADLFDRFGFARTDGEGCYRKTIGTEETGGEARQS